MADEIKLAHRIVNGKITYFDDQGNPLPDGVKPPVPTPAPDAPAAKTPPPVNPGPVKPAELSLADLAKGMKSAG